MARGLWLQRGMKKDALRALAACEAAAGSEPVLVALRATKDDENPWRAANLGRSRLFRRPEPAAGRIARPPGVVFDSAPLEGKIAKCLNK